jgi:hypothetical protein
MRRKSAIPLILQFELHDTVLGKKVCHSTLW